MGMTFPSDVSQALADEAKALGVGAHELLVHYIHEGLAAAARKRNGDFMGSDESPLLAHIGKFVRESIVFATQEAIARFVEKEAQSWEHIPQIDSAIAGVAGKIRAREWDEPK